MTMSNHSGWGRYFHGFNQMRLAAYQIRANALAAPPGTAISASVKPWVVSCQGDCQPFHPLLYFVLYLAFGIACTAVRVRIHLCMCVDAYYVRTHPVRFLLSVLVLLTSIKLLKTSGVRVQHNQHYIRGPPYATNPHARLDYWQETLFHYALSGSGEFYYFNPIDCDSSVSNLGDPVPRDIEVLSATLAELTALAGCVKRSWVVDSRPPRVRDNMVLTGMCNYLYVNYLFSQLSLLKGPYLVFILKREALHLVLVHHIVQQVRP